MKKNAVMCIIWLMIGFIGFTQQSELDLAWNNLKINNISEARKYFTTATNNTETKAEAFLMLSLLASIDRTPDESLQQFIRFTEVCKEDINPYLRALWYTGSVANGIAEKLDQPRVEFLSNLLQSGKLNTTTEAYTLEALGHHYRYSNDFEKSDEYFGKIGSVYNWQITGEFDNASGSGFDKQYGPIFSPSDTSVFTDKYQAQVKWFEMKNAQPGRWLYLTYHFFGSKAVIYAQTFCYSPVQQDVALRIGTSGSLKTWVNDKLLFTEADERNNGTDTYVFTARLNKGYNRILLQIGNSEIDRSNFLVRISDLEENILKNLTFSSSYQPYIEDKSDFQSQIIPSFAETFFLEKIEKEPDVLLNYILLTDAYLANDKSYFAQKTIQKAQKLAPDCSLILNQLITDYSRDENTTKLSMALEKLKEIDPENPMSVRLFYYESIKKKEYEEAKKLLFTLEKTIGRNELILGELISIASLEKRYEDAYYLIEEAYKNYPDNSNFVYLKFVIEKEISKDILKSGDILKKYLKNNYDPGINQHYANAVYESGRLEKSISSLLKITEFNPAAYGYYIYIGDWFFGIRDYKTAIYYYEKANEIGPFLYPGFSRIAQCYEEMNSPEIAIQYYKKAIAFNPNDYESREKIRKIEGKPAMFSYFDAPDFYQLFKSSPDASDYPGENSLVLYHETQRVLYPEGGNQEKNFVMVKVFNTDGIDYWKEYTIPFYDNQSFVVEKAEVIKKNGTKVKAETNYDQIVFTSLEEGDAITLIYRINTFETGKFIKHFSDKFYFSYFVPASKLKYSLLVPPDIHFQYVVTNSDLKPEITSKEDFNLYVWEKQDIPSIKSEQYMPDITDVGNVLFLSSYPNWDFLSDWYNDVTNSQLKSDFIVQEKIKELFEGRDNLSDMEKVEIIYKYVTTEIRYSSVPFRQNGIIPQKASKVISTNIGDCKDVSTLFVALCRESGIDAYLVLVSTRTNGRNTTLLPDFVFDHSIAKVTIDGLDYYVELTSDMLSFGYQWYDVLGASALIIDDKKDSNDSIVSIVPPTKNINMVIRNIEAEFRSDTIVVRTESKKSGYLAAHTRYYYRGISNTEQRKIMASSITNDFSNAELLNLEFDESLNDASNEIAYNFDYQISNAITRISDLEIFELPFSDRIQSSDFNFGSTRDYPVELWKANNYYNVSEKLSLKIPTGKMLAEIPQNIEYHNKIAHYQLSFQVKNNVLIAERRLTFSDDTINKADYPEFKEFFNKVRIADAMKIALTSKDKTH